MSLREQLLPPTQLGEVPTLTRNDKTCLREELLPPTQLGEFQHLPVMTKHVYGKNYYRQLN